MLLEERQDLVYREKSVSPESWPDPGAAADQDPVGPPLVAEGDGWRFRTDPTPLMRFSGATANARIHYDWPYTTGVEGYPGLVVHGPLMALVLAESLRLTVPTRRLRRVGHRNTTPLFCGHDANVTLDLTADPDTAEAVLRAGYGASLAGVSADLTPVS